jgi:hypothetical protein
MELLKRPGHSRRRETKWGAALTLRFVSDSSHNDPCI